MHFPESFYWQNLEYCIEAVRRKTMTTKQLTGKIVQSPELKAKVEELVKQYDKTGKRWKPERNQVFYYIASGEVSSTTNDGCDWDVSAYKTGNCYRTRELAQKALDRQLLLQELKDFAMEVNRGQDHDEYGDSSYIEYNAVNDKLTVYEYKGERGFVCGIRFATKDLASKAISHFGDRLKILFEKEVWG